MGCCFVARRHRAVGGIGASPSASPVYRCRHSELRLGGVCHIDVSCLNDRIRLPYRKRVRPWTALYMRHAVGRPVDWLGSLKSAFGDGWLFFAAVLIYLVANSGIIPKWLGERRGAQAQERAEVAEDRRQLIENYEDEATNQRRWRIEDAQRYEMRLSTQDERIERQEQTIARLAAAVESCERGNARLRHLIGNLFQHIAAQRAAERRRGVVPIPYDGWREALNISPDLDQRLRALFEDIPEVDVPDGTGC